MGNVVPVSYTHLDVYKRQELEYFIDRGEMRKAKYACIVTAAINLGVLGFYKYYGFVIENLNAILPFDIPYTKLALPIGISFYTFQTMSYVIDVYRGKVKAQHNPCLLYTSTRTNTKKARSWSRKPQPIKR